MRQVREAGGEPGGAVPAGEAQQRLDDGADAVAGHGVGVGGGGVHQGVQGAVEVEVGSLEPVREFLVPEPVTVPGRDEQPFGEHGVRPSGRRAAVLVEGGPGSGRGEQLLERRAVQRPVLRAEAAAGRLVRLSGGPYCQSAYGGAVGAEPSGEALGDPQARQVQMGGEHVVAVDGAVGRRRGDVGADLGEQPQGQRVGRVGVGDGASGMPWRARASRASSAVRSPRTTHGGRPSGPAPPWCSRAGG